MALTDNDEIALILSYLESPDFAELLDGQDKALACSLVHAALVTRRVPIAAAIGEALVAISRDLLRSGYLLVKYRALETQYEALVARVRGEEGIAVREGATAKRLTADAVKEVLSASPRIAELLRSQHLIGALAQMFWQIKTSIEARQRALEHVSNNERQAARSTLALQGDPQ